LRERVHFGFLRGVPMPISLNSVLACLTTKEQRDTCQCNCEDKGHTEEDGSLA
jgi:hypothetical protein